MSYNFFIGKFLNGEGLDRALDRGIEGVNRFASGQVSRIRGAFIAGGHHRHGGSRWQALAASTIKRKGHAKILIDKGVLRNSPFYKVIRALPDGFVVDVGTNIHYARYHQTGNARLPQRKVIDVTEQDRRILGETFGLWAERALNGQFFSRLGV